MVALVKRMRHLKGLLNIRLGPGAAILSGDVKQINLRFAKKINDGHRGPRKFWHECLPRLKYHNPAIPMTVDRSDDQAGPAILTVIFTDSDPGAPTDAATASRTDAQPSILERVESIDMKHKHESEILSQFMQLTRGVEVRATEAELQEIEELEEAKKTSQRDRVRQAGVLAAKRRERDVLARAMANVDEQ